MVVVESFEKLRVLTFIVCGGSGFVEKSDIVDRELETELESLYHGLVDSDTDVRAESLVNLACLDSVSDDDDCGKLCDGTVRFGLLGLGRCCSKFAW